MLHAEKIPVNILTPEAANSYFIEAFVGPRAFLAETLRTQDRFTNCIFNFQIIPLCEEWHKSATMEETCAQPAQAT